MHARSGAVTGDEENGVRIYIHKRDLKVMDWLETRSSVSCQVDWMLEDPEYAYARGAHGESRTL